MCIRFDNATMGCVQGSDGSGCRVSVARGMKFAVAFRKLRLEALVE